jgi:hypothetical protein
MFEVVKTMILDTCNIKKLILSVKSSLAVTISNNLKDGLILLYFPVKQIILPIMKTATGAIEKTNATLNNEGSVVLVNIQINNNDIRLLKTLINELYEIL